MKYLHYKPTDKEQLSNVEYPMVMVNAYENVHMVNNDLYVWNNSYNGQGYTDVDDKYVVIAYSTNVADEAINTWGDTTGYLAEETYTYDVNKSSYRNRVKVNQSLGNTAANMFDGFNAGDDSSNNTPIQFVEVNFPNSTYLNSNSIGGMATKQLNLGYDTQLTAKAMEAAHYINKLHIKGFNKIENDVCSSSVGLTEVQIDNNGKYVSDVSGVIGSSAFQGCTNLKTVKFAKVNSEDTDNYTTISDAGFRYCTSLDNIDLSDVKCISSYAFDNTGLTNVTLPMNIMANNKNYERAAGPYISGSSALVGVELENKLNELYLSYIPSSENLGNFAFANCANLTTASHTDGKLHETSTGCFYGCTSLKDVDFPTSRQYLPWEFAGTKLSYIYIDKNIVRENAFYMSNLGSVHIEDGSNLQTNAFYAANIDKLEYPNLAYNQGAGMVTNPFYTSNINHLQLSYIFYQGSDTTTCGYLNNYFSKVSETTKIIELGNNFKYDYSSPDISAAAGIHRVNVGISDSSVLETVILNDSVNYIKYPDTWTNGAFSRNTALKTVKIGAGILDYSSCTWCAFTGCSVEKLIVDTVSASTVENELKGLMKQVSQYELIYSRDHSSVSSSTPVKNASVLTIRGDVNYLDDTIFGNLSSNTKLTTLKYEGTIAEWNKITKGNYWKIGLTNITQVECSDGTVAI